MVWNRGSQFKLVAANIVEGLLLEISEKPLVRVCLFYFFFGVFFFFMLKLIFTYIYFKRKRCILYGGDLYHLPSINCNHLIFIKNDKSQFTGIARRCHTVKRELKSNMGSSVWDHLSMFSFGRVLNKKENKKCIV